MIIRYLCKFFIMKQLITLAILFTLSSCSNKKAEIVEEIKSAKDSFQLYKNWSSFYSLLGKEMEDNGKPELSDKRFLEQVPQYVLDNKLWDSARISNWGISFKWQSIIDSLELELKKY